MSIEAKQVYEWVKTGHWSKRQFMEWVEATANNAEESSTVQEPVADIEKLKENSVGFCEVLTMDDVADIIANAQKITPPYDINYMTVMQLTEKKVLEKFK